MSAAHNNQKFEHSLWPSLSFFLSKRGHGRRKILMDFHQNILKYLGLWYLEKKQRYLIKSLEVWQTKKSSTGSGW